MVGWLRGRGIAGAPGCLFWIAAILPGGHADLVSPLMNSRAGQRFHQGKGLSWAICSGCLLNHAASCRPHRVAAVNERWLQSQRQTTSPLAFSTWP